MMVTSDSACNRPADSNVWWSSTNNPSAKTFPLRSLRSIGSSHCFFFWSIAFNVATLYVGLTLTVRSTPSKVFTFSSRNMAKKTARWEFWCLNMAIFWEPQFSKHLEILKKMFCWGIMRWFKLWFNFSWSIWNSYLLFGQGHSPNFVEVRTWGIENAY